MKRLLMFIVGLYPIRCRLCGRRCGWYEGPEMPEKTCEGCTKRLIAKQKGVAL